MTPRPLCLSLTTALLALLCLVNHPTETAATAMLLIAPAIVVAVHVVRA